MTVRRKTSNVCLAIHQTEEFFFIHEGNLELESDTGTYHVFYDIFVRFAIDFFFLYINLVLMFACSMLHHYSHGDFWPVFLPLIQFFWLWIAQLT